MKTKHWIILLSLLLALCILASLLLIPRGEAQRIEIMSQGKVIRTADLSEDQQFTVTTADGGVNVITIQDGKVAVTEASCPDPYCMHRGWCSGGTEIVCLPNRLVIRFLSQQEVDGLAG